MNAASAYNSLYGNANGSAIPGVGAAAPALGAITGFKQGGVWGDSAGVLGLGGLAKQAGWLSPGVAAALGPASAALGVGQFVSNWQSGKTGSDALNGAEAGAGVGALFGPVGAGVGAVAGGAIGALSSAFGPGATDPEQGIWQQYQNAYQTGANAASANDIYSSPAALMARYKAGQAASPTGQQIMSGARGLGNVSADYQRGGAQAVAGASGAQNYGALAGLFDSRSSDLPFYQQFGRMGSGAFTQAMAGQINSAINAGQISPNASPQQIFSQVVNPWISSMGKGWGSNTHEQDAVSQLLTNMIGNYQQGSPFYTIGGSPVSMPTYG